MPAVKILSFGFRYDQPPQADLVFDVRFLKNPHWDEVLRPGSGLDEAIGAYIEKDENFHLFMVYLKSFLKEILPLYDYEGREELTIAVGCTGGRHRSVYTAQELKEWLEEETGQVVAVTHRDINRAA